MTTIWTNLKSKTSYILQINMHAMYSTCLLIVFSSPMPLGSKKLGHNQKKGWTLSNKHSQDCKLAWRNKDMKNAWSWANNLELGWKKVSARIWTSWNVEFLQKQQTYIPAWCSTVAQRCAVTIKACLRNLHLFLSTYKHFCWLWPLPQLIH